MSLPPYSLEWLISPLPVEAFRDAFWQRRAGRLATDRPAYFDGLFGYAALEQALECGQPAPPSIRLASSEAERDAEVPCRPDGRLDLDGIRRRFVEGHTVILNNVQNYDSRVNRLVQALQARTSYPIEANCYLTPPRSQGFKPHYDTHDVIVVQVAGEKCWRVYGEEAACPLPQLTNGDPFRREALPVPEVLRLVPGDVMYIPRGWIHEAETDESGPSLHLTLGIHAPTGRDLLRAAVDVLCRVHPEFRTPLPLGYLCQPMDREGLQEALARVVELLARDGSAEAAVGLLEDDFVRRGRSAGPGELVATVEALEGLDGSAWVERKSHLHARLVELEDGVGLQFLQSVVQGSPRYEEAMRFVLEARRPFRVGELPGLDPERQVGLIRRLLCDGLVRWMPSDPPTDEASRFSPAGGRARRPTG